MHKHDKPKVEACLKSVKGVQRWSVDFYDEYFPLSVAGYGFYPEHINNALRKAGFECEELV